jgi:hypothetical protein
MRKFLWIMTVLVAAVVAPNAQAQTPYTFDWTGANAPVLTGTVEYNSGTQTLAPFSLTWNSLPLVEYPAYYTATLDPVNDSFTWTCLGNVNQSNHPPYSASCYLYDTTTTSYIWIGNDPSTGTNFGSPTGTLTFAPLTTTPEPNSMSLALLGIFSMLVVMRKRLT